MMKPYRAAQLTNEVALFLGDRAAAGDAQIHEPAIITPPAATAEQRPAILVVEDDPRSRAIAIDLFAGLGLAVFDAWNGRDALVLLVRHEHIAVLFTDVRLPGMTGLELAEQARRLRPALKIVLTSAYTEVAHAEDMTFVAKRWQSSDFRGVADLITSH